MNDYILAAMQFLQVSKPIGIYGTSSMTETEQIVLEITRIISCSLGLLGSLFLTLPYILIHDMRNSIMKLVFLLGVTEFVKGIVGLMDYPNSSHNYCITMAYLDDYANYSNYSCIGVISWAIYINAKGKWEGFIHTKTIVILMILFLLPAALAALPFINNDYGNRNVKGFNCMVSEGWAIFSFVIDFTIVGFSLFCYFYVSQLLLDDRDEHNEMYMKKISQRMMRFILVAFFCSIIPGIETIIDYILEGSVIFILVILHLVSYHTTGLWNAMIFGMNNAYLKKLWLYIFGKCCPCWNKRREEKDGDPAGLEYGEVDMSQLTNTRLSGLSDISLDLDDDL